MTPNEVELALESLGDGLEGLDALIEEQEARLKSLEAEGVRLNKKILEISQNLRLVMGELEL